LSAGQEIRSSDTDPPTATIGALLRAAAERFSEREFLRCPDGRWSFAAADRYTGQLAHVLTAHGVRPGDRVAIMMDNVAGWPLSWFAILKAGAVAVPVDARYRDADLLFVLRDSGAGTVLTTGEHAEFVRSAAGAVDTVREVHTLADLAVEIAAAEPGAPHPGDADPTAVANFQYTSGTTGFPKACMLTHDYWVRTAWLIVRAARLGTDDVVLMTQPFSYLDPQWTVVMSLLAGNPYVLLPRFSASGFWAAIREHGATVTYVLGTMPLLLFKQPPHPRDRDHRVRLVLCSAIVADLHAGFEQRWGAPWREIYGSTESGLDLIVAPEEADCVGSGAIGHPPPGKEVRVVDENGDPVPDGRTGEIVTRGVPMMLGYWNHPEATRRALRGGWYHTGDLGFRDELGRFHHVGRLKEMIRRGGENISAAQVEDVLGQHPAVLAVALVGIPDDLYGEVPKAFVQPRPGHAPDTDTARSVLDHARRHLARFKVPAYIEFVSDFPLTPSARIRKRALLEPARDQRAGSFDAATGAWVPAQDPPNRHDPPNRQENP
jgi:acyl-CoA synthetase (AMP-forming)/AMP-acid ligase II